MKLLSETGLGFLKKEATFVSSHQCISYRWGHTALLMAPWFLRRDCWGSQCSPTVTAPPMRLRCTCPLKAFERQRQPQRLCESWIDNKRQYSVFFFFFFSDSLTENKRTIHSDMTFMSLCEKEADGHLAMCASAEAAWLRLFETIVFSYSDLMKSWRGIVRGCMSTCCH